MLVIIFMLNRTPPSLSLHQSKISAYAVMLSNMLLSHEVICCAGAPI